MNEQFAALMKAVDEAIRQGAKLARPPMVPPGLKIEDFGLAPKPVSAAALALAKACAAADREPDARLGAAGFAAG